MKKESKFRKYLEWALLAILVFGTLHLFTGLDFIKDLKPETSGEKWIMWIGIFIMAFIVLGVHELGHLLVGLIQGFKFQLFVVGPLGIKREEEKIKVYFNTNLGYYGGVAATTPVDDNSKNAKKFANVLLAGPIASVLFAIISLGIAYLIGKPFGVVFYAGSAISVAIFYATTIPSRTGMFFTDRKRYQRLTTPGKDQKVELAMLRIMGKFSKENSYKNIDLKDIEELVTDEMPFIRFFGLFNLICFHLENNNQVEESVKNEYEIVSKEMSKNLVTAFDKEIEKFRIKLKMED